MKPEELFKLKKRLAACHFHEVKNGELKSIRDNLLASFDRIFLSLTIPQTLMYAGLWTSHVYWLAAEVERKENGTSPLDDNEEAQKRRWQRFEELQTIEASDAHAERLQELAANLIVNDQSPAANGLFLGLESFVEGVVTASYTAFEVAAADTWRACINARPRLGFIALNAEPLPTDDPTEKEKKERAKILIPAWMLKDPTFDIRSNMGTMLSTMKKWDFANRRDTKDAYCKVLPDDKDKITAIFDAPEIGWLAATRNAVVHNAGRADAEFRKLIKNHPMLKSVLEGDRIPMTADVIGPLAVAAFSKGQDLVLFVDAWLTSNKT